MPSSPEMFGNLVAVKEKEPNTPQPEQPSQPPADHLQDPLKDLKLPQDYLEDQLKDPLSGE